jgi:hypothetical protein
VTEAEAPRAGRRRRRIVIALLVLVASVLAGVWLSRVPIATRLIDRELAAKGVPARYHIADLGFGRQRLTDVVIGDPAAPDLVADWIETSVDVSPSGPGLAAVRAGHVRIRARLVDGRVSLGAIDRLLPASSGGPFALPALDVAVEDARIRLETPAGLVGLSVTGRGPLNDGFAGRLAAVAPSLGMPGCVLERVDALVSIRVRRAAPSLAGPVRAATARCRGAALETVRATIDATLSPALDRWSGDATLAAASVRAPSTILRAASGTIDFAGTAQRTQGKLALAADGFAAAGVGGRGLSLAGQWRVTPAQSTFVGRSAAGQVMLPAHWRRQLAAMGATAAGTPVAPLAAAVGRGLADAGERFAVEAEVAATAGAAALATVRRLTLIAATGARLSLTGGEGVMIGDPRGPRIDGQVALAGGGLPVIDARVAQRAPGAPVTGTAALARYATGGAALSLTPVRFAATPHGTTRIATTVTLDGPLGDGRVQGLTLPIDARWDGAGALTVNPTCTPVSVARLAASGLTLSPSRLSLCPTGAALLRIAGGTMAGGARIAAPRLTGAIGGAPLMLAAQDATLRLGDRAFSLTGVTTRIGAPDRETRIDAATISGKMTPQGIAGTFAGLAGQLANVPLLMSAGEGVWGYNAAGLGLTGALKVADAAPQPRFQPLDARNVALGLRDGEIGVAGTLFEPTKSVKVADVAIGHRLSSGAGHATLSVPGITFAEGFQPELLTRLTFGVIADVRGTVRGQGDIAWNADGVTSTGTFTTDGTDLAAAFGPVEGIAGTIRFTDLLSLESAPGQVVTIKSLNPGVPVPDGRVTFQTLAGTRVSVAGGVWPFAGGTLTLEPTMLDFAAPQARKMVFRVEAMDAGQFLQRFDFKNLNATGTFDGVLPILFDDNGGRVEGGRLAARAPGGSLAYVGELSEKDLGVWGNLAFQSLKSLTFRTLDLQMNGPLAGEMVTGVRFTGIRQGKDAKSNFLLRRLTRLPILFNITIRAPFRGLIDSAASFYDPQRLVARNLQSLIQEQNRQATSPKPPSIQPPASETVP